VSRQVDRKARHRVAAPVDDRLPDSPVEGQPVHEHDRPAFAAGNGDATSIPTRTHIGKIASLDLAHQERQKRAWRHDPVLDDYALLGLIVGRTFLLGAIGEAGVVAVQLALARRAGAWMAQQLRRRLSRESLSVPATAAARLSASQFAWATIGEADVARITRCRGRRGQRMIPQVRMIDDFGLLRASYWRRDRLDTRLRVTAAGSPAKEPDMRNVVLIMTASIDGYVVAPKEHAGGLPEPDELKRWKLDRIRRAGTHIMGRVTYEEMAAAWPASTDDYAAPMNDIPKACSLTCPAEVWPLCGSCAG